ncbi:hypothetical protein [Brochothrix thermosphacta]|uniref:hypothetical protein n=1 Tax=Brochothrix thermosphacta TaxID=2756 RepID=UPI0003E88B97|nr:hypothetical protein [Brochothrix thermosphacta]EUJ35318.1 hypothetical protein BTHER_09562 [Brochothrix thermosphacta DSM 20171 = FSL F6-1036]ODJ49552.1 hypothetical protein BFR34_05795 [Brochothrix thermosphacta DSM 20171 = FSL F6-1036]
MEFLLMIIGGAAWLITMYLDDKKKKERKAAEQSAKQSAPVRPPVETKRRSVDRSQSRQKPTPVASKKVAVDEVPVRNRRSTEGRRPAVRENSTRQAALDANRGSRQSTRNNGEINESRVSHRASAKKTVVKGPLAKTGTSLLEKENVLKGLVMAEILAPPKALENSKAKHI